MKTFEQYLNENKYPHRIIDIINQYDLIKKYGEENLGIRAAEYIYHNFSRYINELIKDKEYFNELLDYFLNDKSNTDIKRSVEMFRHHDMDLSDVKRIFGNEFVENINTHLLVKDPSNKTKFLMDLLQSILQTECSIKKSRS